MMTISPVQAFPASHLPYGLVSTTANSTPRLAIAYKTHAIIVSVLEDQGVFKPLSSSLAPGFSHAANWNAFAAQPSSIRQQFRKLLQKWIAGQGTDLSSADAKAATILLTDVKLHYPMDTRNFSDFYCSYEHTKNVSLSRNLFVFSVSSDLHLAPHSPVGPS